MTRRGATDLSQLTPLEGGNTLASEWWIAWSHLRSRHSVRFINVITGLSVLGVIVGVAVLNCVVAVMTGFEIEMQEKILGANSHLVVLKSAPPGADPQFPDGEAIADRVAQIPGITAAAPFVYFELMARSDVAHQGIVIKGVDPIRTQSIIHLHRDLTRGLAGPVSDQASRDRLFRTIGDTLPGPASSADATFPPIFVGERLLDALRVDVGDTIDLINPVGGGVGLMGLPSPTVRTFLITAAFDSGMAEYDQRWTYLSNEHAREFLQVGDRSTGIEANVDDLYAVEALTDQVELTIGHPFYSNHWMETHGRLFAALRQEKYVASLVTTMIMGVASLLIVSTLIMVVLTKGREIALLKALGASDWMVMRIFVIEGTFIGAIGVLLGTALGLAAALGLKAYGLPLEAEELLLTTLPVVIQPSIVVSIGLTSVFLCTLTTLIPAVLAARLDPVTALQSR